jgi:autotransporter-associated beta strand protein
MKPNFTSKLIIAALCGFAYAPAFGDTTWISTSSSLFTTVGNWNNGLPSTGPQLAIFADSATIQHTIDFQGTTARNTIGIRFDSFAGGAGFVMGSSTANSPGWQSRAGGSVNGVLNNDNNTQTFNVSLTLFTSTGIAGAGAAQTFNAAAGPLIFSGNHPAGRSTVNNNGGTVTIDGAYNVTIGIGGATYGDLIGTGGLIKNGAGTLTLGGTAANTFSGGTTLNSGTIVAGKPNALGSGGLVASGGTFNTGGFNQTLGTLDLNGSLSLDLASGVSAVSFANSSALDWGTFNLNISNWTLGSDTLRFGTDGTGLTAGQLLLLDFLDFGDAHGQIDASGYITPVPVPEPGTVAFLVFGFAGLFMWRRMGR